MPVLRLVTGILPVGLLMLNSDVVHAEPYPSKPLRILTSSIGGGGDFTARQVAQGITGPLGQPVIVDNRASGVLVAEIVAKAPPDGYTLALRGPTFWVLPLL